MPAGVAQFFNRRHAVQGASVLATAFAMLGTTFAGLDWGRYSEVRVVAGSMLMVSIGCAVGTAALDKSLRAGLKPLGVGMLVGLAYLGIVLFIARTGG